MEHAEIYDWLGFDKDLFLIINGFHAPFYDHIMLTASWFGHPNLYPFYMIFSLFLAWKKQELMPLRNVVIFSISYVLISVVSVPVLKYLLDFPRPLMVIGARDVVILGSQDANHSFPSGHAAYAVLVAASLISSLPRVGKILLIGFSILVCFSRIVVGAHFFTDVLAGASISLCIVFVVRKILPN